MKPHKHAELIKQWADGAEIQGKVCGEWIDAKTPNWSDDCEYRIKPTEWEPNKGGHYIDATGSISLPHPTDELLLSNVGNSYATREQAEYVAEQTRKLWRLMSYVLEHEPDWRPDWDDDNQKKWYVYFDSLDKVWMRSYSTYVDHSGLAIMPRRVAEQLCKDLNSGRVKL